MAPHSRNFARSPARNLARRSDRRLGRRLDSLAAAATLALAAAAVGCPSDGENGADSDAGGSPDAEPTEPDATPDATPDADAGPCLGLDCDRVGCSGEATTTVSGVVTIPSGELPLPGVDIWIPRHEIDPIEHGPRCAFCDDLITGRPLAHARSDESGAFVLEDTPAGDDLPLVIQIGDWRREVTIDVDPCRDNPIEDEDKTRLPRNQDEGDLPRIALTTGGCDALECLLRKIGIDESEFTPAGEGGAVQLYQGGANIDLPPGVPAGRGEYSDDPDYDLQSPGEAFAPAEELWSDYDSLARYDIVLHACECKATTENKSPEARAALERYAEAGGRAFLSHWHYVWLEDSEALAAGDFDPGTAPPLDEEQTAHISRDFDRGDELAAWMLEVGGSPAEAPGTFPFYEARATLGEVDREVAEQWIHYENPAEGGYERPQYMSFDTPTDSPVPCGRVVFSDIHVSSEHAGGDRAGEHYPFPEGCTADLQPQEKALLYLFFDTGACIERDAPPIE